MAICMECVRNKWLATCGYCGECHHLCKLKCSHRTRIEKMKILKRERSRVFYAKDEPVKAIKKPNGKWAPEYLGL